MGSQRFAGPLGGQGHGLQPDEPVADRVSVPDRLDRQNRTRETLDTARQGFQVEGAVRGSRDPVAIVRVTVRDDVLSYLFSCRSIGGMRLQITAAAGETRDTVIQTSCVIDELRKPDRPATAPKACSATLRATRRGH